ncbi:MAG: hypothetical protein Q9223_003239, partial [Gallowayella weberi]
RRLVRRLGFPDIDLDDAVDGEGRPDAWHGERARDVSHGVAAAHDDRVARVGGAHDLDGVTAFFGSGPDAVWAGRKTLRDDVGGQGVVTGADDAEE